jgi:hypothetical protein
MRLRARQHWRDVDRAGAVTAANPMVAQHPYVAGPSDRFIGYLRNAVGIRQTARSQTRQDGLQLIRLEADQANVEAGEPELLELVAELLEIPARPRRQLIVGQPVATLLLLTPTARAPALGAAAVRAWPASRLPSSSTSTGIVHPHLRMAAASLSRSASV